MVIFNVIMKNLPSLITPLKGDFFNGINRLSNE